MLQTSNTNDIICAPATPPGRSALAVIRVSGPGSIACVSRVIPALGTVELDGARRLVYDFACDNDGSPVDEVTAVPYFAPKSYTAEEMVEIICHGGFASSRAIMDRLCRNGARLAEPGEFTKRAFLNGRISLSEAEAVAAAIEAKSELALKAAALNLKGELYERIDRIRRELSELLSLIEAEIDFSEDEIDKTPPEQIRGKITEQLGDAQKVLRTYDFGRGLNLGYRIVIVGKANVGKSSLLNALLNRERAIVTEMPGTTRDTLTEWIDINGFPILLTDTAGLRDSQDVVEKIGQQRTLDMIEHASLVLLVLDCTTDVTAEDLDIFDSLKDKPALLLINKTDLGVSKSLEESPLLSENKCVRISALRGDGLEDLKREIANILKLDSFTLDSALLATERQHQAMLKACDTLEQAAHELDAFPPAEVISVYIREALDHLGELVGETTTEDILNGIFSRFCIGK